MTNLPIVCEVKNQRISNSNETFYRYNVDGTCVWFIQNMVNGNILAADVEAYEKLPDFTFSVIYTKTLYGYYPEDIHVTVNKAVSIKDIDCQIQNLMYARDLANAILSIFSLPEHLNICKKEFSV